MAEADLSPEEKAARLSRSYSQTLNIWVGRFREAQNVIRQTEAERDALQARLSLALDIMTEAQITQLMVRVGVSEDQAPDGVSPLQVVTESTGGCGCG